MPAQIENGKKFDGENSLQSFDAKEYTYTPNQFRSKNVAKCSVFIIIECLLAVTDPFSNLPLTKSAGKNEPFSYLREASLSHSSSFSKCARIV